MKNLLILCFAVAFALTTTLTAFGQSPQPVPAGTNPPGTAPLSEGEIKLLRSDLRSEKKKLIALNVNMTVEEATRFWPVYDQYVGEMTKLHDGFYATVKDYSDNSKTWNDTQAAAMLNKWVDVSARRGEASPEIHTVGREGYPGNESGAFLPDRSSALSLVRSASIDTSPAHDAIVSPLPGRRWSTSLHENLCESGSRLLESLDTGMKGIKGIRDHPFNPLYPCRNFL